MQFLSVTSLSIWITFHLGSWGLQFAWTALLGGSIECEVPLCNSPLEGLGSIMLADPEFSVSFITGTLGDVGSIIWGLFAVQWGIYKADSLVGSIPGIIVTYIGGASAVGFIVFTLLNRR